VVEDSTPPTTEQAVSDFLQSFLLRGTPTTLEPKSNPKKRQRPDNDDEDDGEESSHHKRKRRKKEKKRIMAAKSVADKVKMLELDLRNIRADPREKENVTLTGLSRASDNQIHKPFTAPNPVMAYNAPQAQSIQYSDHMGDKNNIQFGVHKPPDYRKFLMHVR